jgi:hypothetical protein
VSDPKPYFEAAAVKHFANYENSTQSIHRLTFRHNKLDIELIHDLGEEKLATMKCMLPRRPDYFAFIITSNNILQKVVRRLQPFCVNCYNPYLINQIHKNDTFLSLSEIARKEKFRPHFVGDNRAHGFEITCTYSLKFNESAQVVEPLCQFYKDLIDIFSHEQ